MTNNNIVQKSDTQTPISFVVEKGQHMAEQHLRGCLKFFDVVHNEQQPMAEPLMCPKNKQSGAKLLDISVCFTSDVGSVIVLTRMSCNEEHYLKSRLMVVT